MCTFQAQCLRDTRLDNGGGKFDIFSLSPRIAMSLLLSLASLLFFLFQSDEVLRFPEKKTASRAVFLRFYASAERESAHTSQFKTISANSCTNQMKKRRSRRVGVVEKAKASWRVSWDLEQYFYGLRMMIPLHGRKEKGRRENERINFRHDAIYGDKKT